MMLFGRKKVDHTQEESAVHGVVALDLSIAIKTVQDRGLFLMKPIATLMTRGRETVAVERRWRTPWFKSNSDKVMMR